MMRTPEWPLRYQRSIAGQLSRHRVYLGSFKRLMQSEGWQYGREPLCQHGLTRSRRAYQYSIMASGSSNLKGPLHILLALNIIKIYLKMALRIKKLLPCIHLKWLKVTHPIKKINYLFYMLHPIHIQVVHQSSLAGIFLWHYQ